MEVVDADLWHQAEPSNSGESSESGRESGESGESQSRATTALAGLRYSRLVVADKGRHGLGVVGMAGLRFR